MTLLVREAMAEGKIPPLPAFDTTVVGSKGSDAFPSKRGLGGIALGPSHKKVLDPPSWLMMIPGGIEGNLLLFLLLYHVHATSFWMYPKEPALKQAP